MPGFHDTLSIPGGGHVQSSLQTRRQNSDVRHCQRAPLPDTNNTTLFLRLFRTNMLRGHRILIKIIRYIINSAKHGEDNDAKFGEKIYIKIYYKKKTKGIYYIRLLHQEI